MNQKTTLTARAAAAEHLFRVKLGVLFLGCLGEVVSPCTTQLLVTTRITVHLVGCIVILAVCMCGVQNTES